MESTNKKDTSNSVPNSSQLLPPSVFTSILKYIELIEIITKIMRLNKNLREHIQ